MNSPKAAASPLLLELRWLNLCGFCLRPGFGFPGDDFRIEQARRIYAAGIQFANQVQNEIDWWIFWGRVAGGLNKNQQVDIFQRLSPVLLPRGQQTPAREQQPSARDVACSRQPGTAPVANQDAARRRVDRAGQEGRDGRDRALVPRRASARANCSTGRSTRCFRPPPPRAGWRRCSKIPKTEDAVVAIARRTGDSTRDLAPATIDLVRRKIPEALHPGARRRSGRGPRQSVRRRAAVGPGRAAERTSRERGRHYRQTAQARSADRRRLRRGPLAHAPRTCCSPPTSASKAFISRANRTAEEIGYRPLARGLSDIAAMGGTPLYCLVSLRSRPWTDQRWIDGFYRGIHKLLAQSQELRLPAATFRTPNSSSAT